MQLSTQPAAVTAARMTPRRTAPHLTPQQQDIFQALKKHGPMTVHEISGNTLLMAHEIGKRMSELRGLKCAKPTGETRPSPRGRASAVWEAL